MIKFTRTTDYTAEGGPIKTTQTVGVGTTLYTQCNSERVMSDIWEMITSVYYWDADAGCVRSMWLDSDVEYSIDCEFDTIAENVKSAFYAKNLKRELESAKYEATVPAKGRTVKVVRGKSSKGVEGKVVVMIDRPYSMGWKSVTETKLGVAIDDEMTTYVAKNGKTYPTHKNIVWVWARNCEVINPEVNMAEVESRAMRTTAYQVNELSQKIANFRRNTRSLGNALPA